MAIKISNTTVIDDARNIVNVPNANYTGIVTGKHFYNYWQIRSLHSYNFFSRYWCYKH